MNSGTVCVVLQLVAKCCQGGSGNHVLDGHLVGSIGEAAAEALFAITLVPASTTGYDAVTDAGRKVEIKATFGTSSVSVRPTSSQHEGAALIV